MKYGVVLPMSTAEGPTDPSAIIDLAYAAMELHYDSLWIQDDPVGRGLDAPTMLAAISNVTSHLRLGFSIMVLPQREAIVTARQLATLDLLCDGRLVVGVGVGSAHGRSPVYDVAVEDRGRLLDEQIAEMRRVWAGEKSRGDGRWLRFPGGKSPRPLQDPLPVYIGTWGNEGGLRRVARSGQGWLASGIRTKMDRYAAAGARLDELLREVGREPGSVERGFVNCPLALADTTAEGVAMAAPLLRAGYGMEPHEAGVPFVGTADDARATLDRVRLLNPDLVCVFPQRLEARMLERFRDEVAGDF